MANDDDLTQLIGAVETRLRERVQVALDEGRYGDAKATLQLLDTLIEAAEVAVKGFGGEQAPMDSNLSEKSSDPEVQELSARLTADEPSEPDEQYPTYEREDDQLVKVGWSTKNEREYRHRAPRVSIAAICDRIEQVAQEKQRFDRDDLDDIKEDGDQIPDYRVYLCLGWLRWAGLVNRTGRGAYSVPNLKNFSSSVEAAWDQLPERQ